MPLRSDWSGEQCPIARSLEILGDPWVLLVLRQAFSGVRRFDQLRSELKIADNVLSTRLARLVDPAPTPGCGWTWSTASAASRRRRPTCAATAETG